MGRELMARQWFTGVLAASAFWMSGLAGAPAADLPAATKKILTDAKHDLSILDGFEYELAIPNEWLDGAHKEKIVKFSSTLSPSEFKRLIAPFQERYPGVRVEYTKATAQQREMTTMVAFETGRYLTDVLSSFGGAYHLFVKANALEDMRDLPAFSALADTSKSPEGLWVAYRRQYYCTSYNTDLVKASDLPKTWDDILTSTVLRDRNIGAANLPQLWLLALWGTNGEQYVNDYIERFFTIVKPQLRKEGASALVSLVVAGEFKMSIPASEYRVLAMMKKGAPVSFHCPDPVPVNEPRMAILRGNPHPYASRIFANWLISKEGQIALHAATGSPPVHKDLQSAEFIPFADQLLGRRYAIRTDELLEENHEKLLAVWNQQWRKSGGEAPKDRGE